MSCSVPASCSTPRSISSCCPTASATESRASRATGCTRSFPKYTYNDMVDAQHELLTKGLGVNHLRLVMGTSMGCMHAWVWGERYPDFVDGLVPLACAPTQIAGRNRMIRTMIMDFIRNDPGYNGGDYTTQPRGPAAGDGHALHHDVGAQGAAPPGADARQGGFVDSRVPRPERRRRTTRTTSSTRSTRRATTIRRRTSRRSRRGAGDQFGRRLREPAGARDCGAAHAACEERQVHSAADHRPDARARDAFAARDLEGPSRRFPASAPFAATSSTSDHSIRHELPLVGRSLAARRRSGFALLGCRSRSADSVRSSSVSRRARARSRWATSASASRDDDVMFLQSGAAGGRDAARASPSSSTRRRAAGGALSSVTRFNTGGVARRHAARRLRDAGMRRFPVDARRIVVRGPRPRLASLEPSSGSHKCSRAPRRRRRQSTPRSIAGRRDARPRARSTSALSKDFLGLHLRTGGAEHRAGSCRRLGRRPRVDAGGSRSPSRLQRRSASAATRVARPVRLSSRRRRSPSLRDGFVRSGGRRRDQLQLARRLQHRAARRRAAPGRRRRSRSPPAPGFTIDRLSIDYALETLSGLARRHIASAFAFARCDIVLAPCVPTHCAMRRFSSLARSRRRVHAGAEADQGRLAGRALAPVDHRAEPRRARARSPSRRCTTAAAPTSAAPSSATR